MCLLGGGGELLEDILGVNVKWIFKIIQGFKMLFQNYIIVGTSKKVSIFSNSGRYTSLILTKLFQLVNNSYKL